MKVTEESSSISDQLHPSLISKVFESNKIFKQSNESNTNNQFSYKIPTHLPDTDFVQIYDKICKNFLFWLFNFEKTLFITELKCLRKIAFFRLIKDNKL
jgi:hypothetical protein